MAKRTPREPDPNAVSLSVPQAARRIGISQTKAYELLTDPDRPLPHVRIGRRVVVPVAALQRWIDEAAA